MRILVLDGLRQSDAYIEPICGVAIDELRAKGWEADSIALRGIDVDHCRGCFKCWAKTPGICIINDAMRDIANRVVQSDVVLLVTPVTFGGYSSEPKKAMDRLIPLISPFFTTIGGEVHHKPRYEKYPALLGIGILGKSDKESERTFKTLVGRNAINLHSPRWDAEVLISDQKQETVRERIRTLFAKVG
ncbi:MAG: flavodoxin family protein [Actinobacteria bacterium]|nr:flavodoxin family protein [Actinomycetota bacterium]